MRLKIIYKPSGKAGEYAEYAVNLYEGRCGHRCIYCYAPRALHKKVEEMTVPRPKKNALELLERDAAQLEKLGISEHILMSFTTDPYQPIDEELQITRLAISILRSHGLSVAILTKGGRRSERDFDLLSSKAFGNAVKYGATLVFLNDADALKHEPFAAPTCERMASLKKAHTMGIHTWVSLEPVYHPNDVFQIIDLTKDFVDEYKVGKLNYENEAKNVDWKRFGIEVEAKLKALNKAYYIKNDLMKFMER